MMLATQRSSLGLCVSFFVILVVGWKLLSANHAETVDLEGVLDRIVNDAKGGKSDSNALSSGPPRDLIFYSYHETDEARKNFAFFRRHALHAKADFIFMLNGEHTVDLSETRHLPNVRIIERENRCFDLGGYHEVLSANSSILTSYKRFLFLNASLRGPFFPAWADGVCWSDAYWSQLNVRTKLVGMTWNCAVGTPYPPHLQSMIWATDRRTLEEVLMPNLKCYEDMASAISEGETQVAKKVMEAGYEVFAMEGRFNAHASSKTGSGRIGGEKNATAFLEWCHEASGGHDILNSGNYEGTSIHPYETIFAKTNRPWDARDRRTIDMLTEHADTAGYSSYERCTE